MSRLKAPIQRFSVPLFRRLNYSKLPHLPGSRRNAVGIAATLAAASEGKTPNEVIDVLAFSRGFASLKLGDGCCLNAADEFASSGEEIETIQTWTGSIIGRINLYTSNPSGFTLPTQEAEGAFFNGDEIPISSLSGFTDIEIFLDYEVDLTSQDIHGLIRAAGFVEVRNNNGDPQLVQSIGRTTSWTYTSSAAGVNGFSLERAIYHTYSDVLDNDFNFGWYGEGRQTYTQNANLPWGGAGNPWYVLGASNANSMVGTIKAVAINNTPWSNSQRMLVTKFWKYYQYADELLPYIDIL